LILDFSLNRYRLILETFRGEGYIFATFGEFVRNPPEGKVVVLRHDVDRRPGCALRLARLEHGYGVKSTFFFRAVRRVLRPDKIREIVGLGHEIGYHYEDLTRARGDYKRALAQFGRHLETLRKYYPVSSICMHGSPISRFDNRSLWKKFDYREFGIVAEPYLDVDYSRVLYITDTGRRWNDEKANIRDRVEGKRTGRIRSSEVMLSWLRKRRLGDAVILNIHPDRWHGNVLSWTCDLVLQGAKNMVKAGILKFRKDGAK
jgi:hypothetical protein